MKDTDKERGEENGNGKKRALTKSERFKNYCLGIAALTALILGTFNILKGEPTAQKAWDVSEKQINKNRDAINKLGDGLRKLHLMFVHMQGQTEGYNNARLLSKIEKLEQENASLKKGTPVAAAVAPVSPAEKDCAPGWVEVKGRCTKNPTAIAKAAKAAQAEVGKVEAKLAKERKLRKAAEKAKLQMQQIQLPYPKPPAKMAPVPSKLDDAVKF